MRWRARHRGAAAPAAPQPPWAPDAALRASATAPTRWRPPPTAAASAARLRDRHEPPELDLTRRSDDPLQLGGKFFYLRELNGPGQAPGPAGRWAGSRCAMPGPASPSSSPAPTSPAAGQRPRRHPGRGRGRGRGGRAAGELAAAADQPTRPAAHDRADHLPGAGDRTVRLLPPHPVLQRAPRRHLLRARAGRDHRPQPASVMPQSRAGRRLSVRPRGRLPRGGRDRRPSALVGYQDARPCFIGAGTLADAGDPGDRAHARRRRRGPALRLRPDRQPAARGRAAGRRHASSCASSTATPPTRTSPPRAIARHLGQTAARARTELAAVFARVRTLDSSLRAAGDDDACPTASRADGTELVITGTTPRPWTHVIGQPAGPRRRRCTTTARSSRSPATRSRTR